MSRPKTQFSDFRFANFKPAPRRLPRCTAPRVGTWTLPRPACRPPWPLHGARSRLPLGDFETRRALVGRRCWAAQRRGPPRPAAGASQIAGPPPSATARKRARYRRSAVQPRVRPWLKSRRAMLALQRLHRPRRALLTLTTYLQTEEKPQRFRSIPTKRTPNTTFSHSK